MSNIKTIAATIASTFNDIDKAAAVSVIAALDTAHLDFEVRAQRIAAKGVIKSVLARHGIDCTHAVAAEVRDTIIGTGWVPSEGPIAKPLVLKPVPNAKPKKTKTGRTTKYALLLTVAGSKGSRYRIERHVDSGRVRCSCRSFVYGNSKFGPDTCKHIEANRRAIKKAA